MSLVALLLACKGEPEPAPPPPAPAEPAFEVSKLDPVKPQHTAKSPYAMPAGPDAEKTLEVLGAVVQKYGADPTDPWAVAHGVLAFGPSFTLPDGRSALDFLYQDYAEVMTLEGEDFPAFPRTSAKGTSVEPHTDLQLKNLAEVGVDPGQAIKVGGKDFAIADTWRHTVRTTWMRADGSSSWDGPNDMPWGMQAIATWAPVGLQWKAYDGTRMRMDDLAKLMVHVLNTESEFMIQAMVKGQDFEKRGQGIFKYTCGGAHLIQGSAFVVARGFGGKAEQDKIAVQAKLLVYRYPREIAIYAKAMEEHPDKKLILMAQQLKFTGHWLESAHKMAATGQLVADAEAQTVMAQAVDVLIATTKSLKAMGAFDNMEKVKEQNPQLYKDLIGDSAHAIRGLSLALGKQDYSW